jgi:hypothetical protein
LGGTNGAETALPALLGPLPELRNGALLELSDSFYKALSPNFAQTAFQEVRAKLRVVASCSSWKGGRAFAKVAHHEEGG